ncbi:MAG: YkgJ family cysteine cluster protein [Desulfuromonas sp.]|nr:YkgJ family cysteine cluster protein [Desulfuromonas sp.]
MWQPLLDQVKQQHAFLDQINQLCQGEFTAKGGTVHCTKGCGGCCNLNVHCSFIEVLAIAAKLTEPQRALLAAHAEQLQQLAADCDDLKTFLRRSRQQMGNCPFLDDTGSCSIYPLRPLSCRALLSTKEPHYCRLDFATLSSDEKQAFMASLDQQSVNFPTHYLATPQQVGMAAEQQLTESMRHQFGVAVSGNLPYLLHLEIEHQLSEKIVSGEEAVRAILPESLQHKPFLIQIDTSC